MFLEPPFRNFPPYLKILALLVVIISTFLVAMAMGIGISIPLFGRGILDSITLDADYSEPKTVMALKFLQIINQLGVFVIPAIIFVILTDDHFMEYMKLKGRISRFSMIFGPILIIVSLPFVNWLIDINSNIHLPDFIKPAEDWMRKSEDNAATLMDAFLNTGTIRGLLVNLLMIAVIAAIGEELIFRGILVRLFHEWTGNIHVAVFLPAFLFSALHLQFFGFLPRLLLGILLGYIFVWSGSLWVPIFVHFLNNALAVIFAFLNYKGIVAVDFENFGSSQDPLIIGLSLFLMLFTLALLYLHGRGFIQRWILNKKGR